MLIPSFHTSVVSLRRFIKKNVHLDTEKNELTYQGRTFYEIQLRYDQLVLEYNPITLDTNMPTQVAFPVRSAGLRKDSEGTTTLWHRRMGHLHREAVEKLPTAVLGVKLAKTSPISCEPCELAKSHQIVSRRPIERATRPFTRIHIDLIQLQSAYNGDTWILHFLDDYTRMNFVYTLKGKDHMTWTIKEFAAYVHRQYEQHIQIFRTDGERSLGHEFNDWIREQGIVMEISAPYTSAQNGAAERSGGVLLAKARAIRIESKLPQNIWPEIVRTAGYLANRSPSQSLH